MIVAIHQPEYLPWLGFFDKAQQADLFVLLDHVQYRKNYFQNRNRIRSDQGSLWLTVPVQTKGRSLQPILEVQIDHAGSPRWREKCWRSIVQHYQKTPFWTSVAPVLEDFYRKSWEKLAEMNEAIIQRMLQIFGIPVKVVRSSQMKVDGNSGDLLVRICQQVGADTYLSGISGRDYLDLAAFSRVGIRVEFQDFHHPIYRQVYEPFMPCMSGIDLLFHYGPESLGVLQGKGVKRLEQVFV